MMEIKISSLSRKKKYSYISNKNIDLGKYLLLHTFFLHMYCDEMLKMCSSVYQDNKSHPVTY